MTLNILLAVQFPTYVHLRYTPYFGTLAKNVPRTELLNLLHA